MKTVIIRFIFISNTVRETISCFEINADENNYIDKNELITKLKKDWIKYSEKEFCLNRIIILGANKKSEMSIDSLQVDAEATVLYSEIVVPRSTANIDTYTTAKGDLIELYIYPREQNHRFLPHVCAKCKNETIRIALTEEVSLLGKERFSGNNRKNEKIAVEYVKMNKEKFLDYWYEFVETQFADKK